MTENTEQYAKLEARITALEEQRLHVVLSKLDGLAYGDSQVHEDVRALRAESSTAMAWQGERLDSIESMLTENLRRLERHGELLEEIMRRLPAQEGG